MTSSRPNAPRVRRVGPRPVPVIGRRFGLLPGLLLGLAVLLAMLATQAATAAPIGGRQPPLPGAVLRGFVVGEQNWEPGHRGVDLAGAPGDPVMAAAAGRISWSGVIAGVPMVTVQHPDGIRTTYQPVLALALVDDQVSAGQVIGTLQAGHCLESACLHWGVRDGDRYLDPLAWLGGWQDAEVRLLPRSAQPRQLPPPGSIEGADAQPTTGGLPVAGPITSGFGLRVNPISGIAEFHDGVDIAAPCGSPVSSPASGTVLFAGEAGGFGLRVEVDHGGTVTSYSHMSVISVVVGDPIRASDVVGLVGSTGFSTGCHLHYSLYRNGLPTDPLGGPG